MPSTISIEYQIEDDTVERVTQAYFRVLTQPLRRSFLPALAYVSLPAVVSGLILLIGMIESIPLLDNDLASILWLTLFPPILLVSLQISVILLIRWRRIAIRRDLSDWVAKLSDRTIRWTMTEKDFVVRSANGERNTHWHEVSRLTIEEEFWILQLKDNPSLFIPAALLDENARDFLRERGLPIRSTSKRFSF